MAPFGIPAKWTSVKVDTHLDKKNFCDVVISRGKSEKWGRSGKQKGICSLPKRHGNSKGIFSGWWYAVVRVTLIVELPLRLTSFWIISSQISSNFLSNSSFSPNLPGRLEQLKSPWQSSCQWRHGLFQMSVILSSPHLVFCRCWEGAQAEENSSQQ